VLTFDDSLDESTGQRKHEYRFNGRLVPSATQIMKAVGMDPYFGDNAEAKERGRLVHLTCQLYDEDDLNEATLDPVLAGYLAGWKQFRKDWAPARTTIVDIKTGGIPWTVGIQTAMYEILFTTMLRPQPVPPVLIEHPAYSPLGFAGTPDRIFYPGSTDGLWDRLAVQLTEDGKYYPHPCRRRKDRDIARAIIAVYFDSLNHCQ